MGVKLASYIFCLPSPQRDSSRRSSQDRGSRSHRSSGHSAHNSSSHQSSSHHASSRPKRDDCWVCGRKALPGKLACGQCFLEATAERQGSSSSIKDLIKESIRELATVQSTPASPPADQEVAGTSTSHPEGSISEDESILNEEEPSTFDFGLVEPFVVAVKDAIQWEEDPEPPSKTKKYFPHLTKKVSNFPLMEEIKGVIVGEWQKVDKRPVAFNGLQKLYPLAESDAKLFDSIPSVDASVMRLAKNTTLPLEDAVSFKDTLDRRIDTDLKRIYQATGGACKPAVALSSISRATKVWADNIETALRAGIDSEEIIKALDELKLASDFMAEAAIDVLRCSSRAMLYSITARRALWLKPWAADASSKQSWCRIPYDGKALFGEKMDSAITRVTGGKSGLTPQDRSRRKRFAPRPAAQQRGRDSRFYRPGREYRRGWKGSQASFLKLGKPKPATSVGDNQKSF